MNSPFKLLDPYESKDSNAFFGRTNEIRELFSLVNKNRLTFVYGPSGSGKTSLVQCGLASCFNPIDWLPLFIRKGENINRSLRSTIGKALGEDITSEEELTNAIRTLFKRHLRTVYLIFDQFEELYILGAKKEEKERIPFYNTIANLLEEDLPCRLLFIIREDYFGHLNRFEQIVPNLYRNKLRVEPMSRENLHKVIVGSCEVYDIKFGDPEKDPDRILDGLILDHSAVQMTFVQIYLHTLYLRAIKEQQATVGVGDNASVTFNNKVIKEMGPIEAVLRNFLEDREKDIQQQLAEFSPPKNLVFDVLDAFVTREGTKLPISFHWNEHGDYLLRGSSVNQLAHLDQRTLNAVIEALLDFRILRRGDNELELAHDTLATLIDKGRTPEYWQLKDMLHRIEIAYEEHIESEGEHFLDRGQLNRVEDNVDFEKNNIPAEWAAFIASSREQVKKKEQEALKQVQERLEIEQRISNSRKKWVLIVTGLLTLAILAFTVAFWQSRKFLSQKKVADELARLAKIQENNTKAVLDRIYFYEDEFGLATDPINEGKYGFIDKNLNTKIEFRFDEALPFDYTGFAKVKIGKQDQLIDTSGTSYPVVDAELQLNTRVTALDLRNKDLNRLPSYVTEQQTLEVLLLSENQIRVLPDRISQLHQLKSLDLSFNEIGILPPTIAQCSNLNRLILTYNEIESLPSSIGQLQNLVHLNLHSNQLKDLPIEIGELTKLRQLDLGSEPYSHQNQLKELPVQIGQLRSLLQLDLSNNLLQHLPGEFSQLQELRHLDLSYNMFITLPKVLSRLPRLNRLNLANNELKDLPGVFLQLQNLHSLDLRANQFKELPETIFQLPQLSHLYIGGNPLATLPTSISRLNNLTLLDAGGSPFSATTSTSLERLPSEIGELKKLERLHLSFNKLVELPFELGHLPELRWLYLRANLLKELPVSLGQLQSLYWLDLRANELHQLPDEITQLHNLYNLDLQDNELTELPENITEMKSLRTLWLSGNPIPIEKVEALQLAMPWCEIDY